MANSNIGLQYGSQGTLTITLASLGSTSGRQSSAITNTNGIATGIGFQDVEIIVQIKTGASGTSATGLVQVYIAGSLDGGSTFTGGAGASDAAYTTNGNEIPLGSINAVANGTTYIGGPFSIRQALGAVPQEWVVIVVNQTGHALDTTAGSFVVQYQGIGGISS